MNVAAARIVANATLQPRYAALHLRTGDRPSKASDAIARRARAAAEERASPAAVSHLYVAADLLTSFRAFVEAQDGTRLCASPGACVSLATAEAASALAAAAVRGVRGAYGRELADIALDLEVASGADELLSLGKSASFRGSHISTFYVQLKRRHHHARWMKTTRKDSDSERRGSTRNRSMVAAPR